MTDASYTDDPYSRLDPSWRQARQRVGSPNAANAPDPVPGIAHGAIPGLLGVAMAGQPQPPDRADTSFIGGLRRDNAAATPPAAGDAEGMGAMSQNLGTGNAGPGIGDRLREIGGGLARAYGIKDAAPVDGQPPTPPPGPPAGSLLARLGSFPSAGNLFGNPMAGAQPPSAMPALPPGFVAQPPGFAGPAPMPAPVAAQPPAAVPPPSAAPAVAGPPAASPAASGGGALPAIPEGSLLDKVIGSLGKWRDENKTTLLAMAGGLAGSQNWGTGLSRAFTAAGPAQRFDIAQNQQNQTAQALAARGLPPDLARVAAQNPTILQQLLPQVFGAKQYQHVSVKDAFGNEHPMVFDPAKGQYIEPGGAGSVAGGVGGAAAINVNPFLAKGVTQIDPQLNGEEYLKQFSPEMQAAIRDYVDGRATPTGNPRQGFTQAVQLAAKKYGSDIGMPADDTSFHARSTMQKNLALTTPGSYGGMINNGNTALEHLANASDSAVALNNSNGLGIAPLAHLFNRVRALSTDQAAKAEALNTNAGHYGQEVTKFYAGSPGGEAERNRFLSALGGAQSPTELASVLEKEADLMEGKVKALQSGIQTTLGDRGVQQHPVIRQETQAAIQRLRNNISILRGQAQPSAAGTPAPAQPSGPNLPPKLEPGARYIWDPTRGLTPAGG